MRSWIRSVDMVELEKCAKAEKASNSSTRVLRSIHTPPRRPIVKQATQPLQTFQPPSESARPMYSEGTSDNVRGDVFHERGDGVRRIPANRGRHDGAVHDKQVGITEHPTA